MVLFFELRWINSDCVVFVWYKKLKRRRMISRSLLSCWSSRMVGWYLNGMMRRLWRRCLIVILLYLVHFLWIFLWWVCDIGVSISLILILVGWSLKLLFWMLWYLEKESIRLWILFVFSVFYWIMILIFGMLFMVLMLIWLCLVL